MMDGSGLLLNMDEFGNDQRHHIKQGPVLIDLSTLDTNTLIKPRETGRKLFVVKTTDSLQLYADFEDFLNALTLELDDRVMVRPLRHVAEHSAHVGVRAEGAVGDGVVDGSDAFPLDAAELFGVHPMALRFTG